MPIEDRLRLQVRVVQAVYRAESGRLARGKLASDLRSRALGELRSRSVAILENVRAQLDGDATWHGVLIDAMDKLEAEMDGSSV